MFVIYFKFSINFMCYPLFYSFQLLAIIIYQFPFIGFNSVFWGGTLIYEVVYSILYMKVIQISNKIAQYCFWCRYRSYQIIVKKSPWQSLNSYIYYFKFWRLDINTLRLTKINCMLIETLWCFRVKFVWLTRDYVSFLKSEF